MNENKSSLIDSGRKSAKEASEQERRLPTYKFLGFVCYWGKSIKGWWRLKYKSRADRFRAKLNGLKKYLMENLHSETHQTLKKVKRVVQGWIQYHAISDNQSRVKAFIAHSERMLFNWINRKGGKRKMNWTRFRSIMRRIKYPQNFKTTSMFVSF